MSPRLILAALLFAACTDPPLALTRVTAEPPGAHCADGGSAIATGLDDDGDGALDDAEIDDVRYQCVTPPADPAVLVREDPLAPGEACAEGGTSVRVGHDTNGNGQLDDAEIETTTAVCTRDAILEGDLTIEVGTTDVDALRDVRVVTGALLIVDRRGGPGTGMTTVALPALEVVGGGIAVGNAGVDFSALTAVGGDLWLGGATTAAVPRLATVGRSVDLSYSNLSSFAAPALVSIGDALLAINARHLTTIDLPALRTVGHDVAIEGATALTALTAPALTDVGGSFRVTSDFALTSFGDQGELASLARIDGGLTMDFDEGLTGVRLPALETVQGAIAIHLNEALGHVDLPALTAASDITIEGGALTRVGLGALVHVGALSISGIGWNTATVPGVLREVDLGSLVDAASLALGGFGALDVLALPHLTTVTGELQLVGLGGVSAIRLAGLHQAGSILIEDGAPVELTFDPTAYTGTLILAGLDLPATSSITLPGVVGGTAQFANNAAPDLGALRSVHAIGRLLVESNPDLGDLRGLDPALTLDGLEVQFNPALTSLAGLDGIAALRDDLVIIDNATLATLDLPALTAVGGAVDIHGNDALPASESAALLARIGR